MCTVLTVECDEGVQEHFQRSLGKDYPLCIAKQATPQSGTPAPRQPALSAPTKASAKVNGTIDTKAANNALTVTGQLKKIKKTLIQVLASDEGLSECKIITQGLFKFFTVN